MGEAHVPIDIQQHESGCRVRMTEDVAAGPARLVPAPLSDVASTVRNAETRQRLAYRAEGRAA